MAEIPSTPADGNTRVVWVQTLADYKDPKVAELTADTVVDLSCYFTADGWTPGSEQATIADERLCTTQVFGKPGRKTPSLTTKVIDNTNTSDENDAVETLVEKARGYFVERRGIPYETAFAADQVVRVFPAQCGEHQPSAPEANSVFSTTVPMFITADVVTTKVTA